MRVMMTAFGLFLAAPVMAQNSLDTGWDPIIASFEEEERTEMLSGSVTEVPELYELATIIISLTPGGDQLVEDTPYRAEVREHFAPFADHPIVASLAIADRNADWYKAYDFRENAWLYCFDESGEYVERCHPISHVWGRQANSFARNLPLIRDFARQSGFREFYAAHRDFYAREIAEWHARADIGEMQQWLEARFPVREQHYRIIFSPLTAGWHSTQGVSDDDFRVRLLFLQAISSSPADRPWVAPRIVFTEIDHSHVNAISDNFSDRLDSEHSFGGTFWYESEHGNYGRGYSVFNEFMTWAVFELWAREHFPEEMYPRIHEHTANMMENNRHFRYYSAFRDMLVALYDERRGDDISIAVLYPEIIDWAERFRAEHEGS